jgi:hypothetical protein
MPIPSSQQGSVTAIIYDLGRQLGRFYNKHAERDQTTNGMIASSYFDIRSVEQTFEVGGLTSPAANIAWFRPLEFYTEVFSATFCDAHRYLSDA